MVLRVGDKAPLFEGVTDTGVRFSIADWLGKTNLVVYFYPKDDTPGCTREACAFRDSWDKLAGYDAMVIGVSSDSVESHQTFKKKYGLPFTLISDPNGKIRELYGVKGLLIPPRVTFVIDKKGEIVHVFNSQLNPEKHVDEALKALQSLNGRR
ncbi:MAG: peroxiredoxin [Thermoprotei archaeon]